MCSVEERYTKVDNYFVHRRCRSVDGVDPIKTNPSKSEFFWCSTVRRLHFVEHSTFHLLDGDVTTASSIWNLDAYFHESMDMSTHVSMLVSLTFYQLQRVRAIWCSILTSIAIKLIKSVVIFRIDYYNSLLVASHPVRWSAFCLFWTIQSELSIAGGSTTMWHHFWVTNFTGCVFLREWSSNVACWYTRHCTDRRRNTFGNSASTSQRSGGAQHFTQQHTIT